MQYKFSRGAVPVTLDHDGWPDDEDEQGGWVLKLSPKHRAALAGFEFVQYNAFGASSPTPLLGEDAGDGLVFDEAIAAVAVLIEIGEPLHLDASGSSPFWIFHDLIHAAEDWCVDLDSREVFGPEVFGAFEEDRAHVAGTRLAATAGVPVGECLREIVKAAPSFLERFGSASRALEDLGPSLTLAPMEAE